MIKKFAFIGVFVSLIGCKTHELDIDVSDIEANIEIKRLEQDLFTLDFDSIASNVPYLQDKYGEFFRMYSSSRLNNFGDPEGEHFPASLLMFITDYNFATIYQETQEIFPDLENLQNELELAFKHYQYYYPDKYIPTIVTCILKTFQSIIVTEKYLGISVDKYLGSGNEIYDRVGFPKYKRYTMRKEKIVPDAIQAWALTEFEYNDSVDNLLSRIIYHGKIMYFLDAMLPAHHDTVKFGFTPIQLKFCEKNESQMWLTLVEHKLLFETDRLVMNKFLEEAPFTKDFTTGSPGRAVIWVGRQIVKKYMHKTSSSLQELMKEDDYQKILAQSKYNP